MNKEGTGFYTCKECHKTEFLQNHTATVHREREQLGDQRNVGENSCNSGDGTGQMTQLLKFMMVMIDIYQRITGTWRRLHNEELNDQYSSPNIVWVIKSRGMRWAGHLARVGVRRGFGGET
jgi:hypothetical protein